MLDVRGRWLVLLRGGARGRRRGRRRRHGLPVRRTTPWAWAVVGFFAAVTVFSGSSRLVELSARGRASAPCCCSPSTRRPRSGSSRVFSYQTGEPWRALYLIPVAAAALRFGLVGGLVGGSGDDRRNDRDRRARAGPAVEDGVRPGARRRALPVSSSAGSRDTAHRRTEAASRRGRAEAERLRDELGHRVDVLETANRVRARARLVARARGSVRRVHPRAARPRSVRAHGDRPRRRRHARRRWPPPAAARRDVFPPGSSGPIAGSVLERVLRRRASSSGATSTDRVYPADEQLLALGLAQRARDAASASARARSGCSASRANGPTRSARTRSSSSLCSAASSRPPCRTSAPTRPSGRRVEELRASRSSAPTSSRSSRTSCGARWRR